MPRIAIVTRTPERLGLFADAIAELSATPVAWYRSAAEALDAATKAPVDLMVVDEPLDGVSGQGFLRQLLTVNAMINTAVISRLPKDDFHESFEGLGVLLQLPPAPGKQQAQDLLSRLKDLLGPVGV